MTKCNNHKTKYGFSMFEVCVTMAIVVVFIAACTNVFTSRHKARVATYTHGRYECYWEERDDGTFVLQDHLYNESNMIPNSVPISTYTDDNGETISYCTFRPPVNVKSVVVNAVAAGGNGGTNRGGDAGQFTSFYLSNLARELSIAPGRSPREDSSSYPSGTRIIQGSNPDDFNDKTIISLNGGRSASEGNDIYFSDCAVTYNPYSCGFASTCKVDNENNQITVQYCVGNLESNIQNFDPALYRSIKIGYNDQVDEEVNNEKAWWWKNDNCFEGYTSGDFTNHQTFGNGYPYTAICHNEPISGSNTCSSDNIKKGLVTYSHQLVACNDTRRRQDSVIDNDIRTYFSLNLIVGGNRTSERQESEMNGIINALKIPASDEGIASLRDCGTNDDGKTLRCRVSTGDGGAAGNVDNDRTRGGHGSVLITW